MQANLISNLSLVGKYDDIVRRTAPLISGLEDEFIKFLQQRSLNHRNTEPLKNEIEHWKRQCSATNKEKDKLETKLKQIKYLLQNKTEELKAVNTVKKSLEHQLNIIREVLLSNEHPLNAEAKEKLAFLSTNTLDVLPENSPRRLQRIEESVDLLSSTEFSFDETQDVDSDSPPRRNSSRSKRRSSQHRKSSQGKKQKFETDTESADTGSVAVNHYPDPLATESDTSPVRTPYLNQWCRRELVDDPMMTIPKAPKLGYLPSLDDAKISDEPTKVKTPFTSTRLSSGIIDRKHDFVNKTMLRSENCAFCKQKIGFYKVALKCQGCRITCHPECKNKVEFACFPVSHTPTAKGPRSTISDYAPKTAPMIPDILIHCINEIESRGLTEVGLYRVSGSEREVKDLKEKFLKGKSTPFLGKTDIHAVCGTVKCFLLSLYEPLVTRALWKDFVGAVNKPMFDQKIEACRKLINRLPQANRDTLAFLVLHLHKIASSSNCKMPISSLAKVFGPSVVGYSSAEPGVNDFSEATSQQLVMEVFLNLHQSYWRGFVSTGNGFLSEKASRGVNTRSRNVRITKGPLTPSKGILRSSSNTQYFSPILK